MNKEAAARDAAEALRAIEEQQAKRERRIAAEERRQNDRRKEPRTARSGDMGAVADAQGDVA